MVQPGRLILSCAGITMLNSLTWVTQEVRLDYHCPKFCSQKPVSSAHLAAIPGKHKERRKASMWSGYLVSVCCGGRALTAVGKKAADIPENEKNFSRCPGGIFRVMSGQHGTLPTWPCVHAGSSCC